MADRDKRMLIEVIVDDKKGEAVVRENTKALKNLETQGKKTGQSLQYMGSQQDTMRLSSNRANLVLIDTGRIIQDMPYGLRGVANNIDPFIQSLQRARAESGSWGQVLKGLGASLIGPAGIAIGVSTLTSVLVSYGPQIYEFFGIFEDGSKKVKEASDELETFAGRRTQALIDATLQLEQFRNDGPFDTTRLRAQMRLIGETIAELPPLLTDKEKAELEALLNPEASAAAGYAVIKDLSTDQIARRDELLLKQAQANKYSEERNELEGTLNELIKEHLILSSAANTEEGKRIQAMAEAEKKARSEKRATEDLLEARLGLLEADRKRAREDATAGQHVNTDLPAGALQLGEFAGARGIQSLTNALQRYGYTLEQINGMTVEHGQNLLMQHRGAEMLANTIRSGVIASFSEMGAVLGDVMSADFEGGVFERFQLLFSNFLSTFGDQLIVLGVGKLSLDTLFQGPLGGPAAIAAGVALKAAATATRNDAQKRLANITGGGAGTTDNVIIGYRGVSAGREGAAGAGLQFPGSVQVRFTDGTGNIVANGIMEMDRQGRRVYLGGEGR